MTPLEERCNKFCDSVFGTKENQDTVVNIIDQITYYCLCDRTFDIHFVYDEINMFAEIADAIIQS